MNPIEAAKRVAAGPVYLRENVVSDDGYIEAAQLVARTLLALLPAEDVRDKAESFENSDGFSCDFPEDVVESCYDLAAYGAKVANALSAIEGE